MKSLHFSSWLNHASHPIHSEPTSSPRLHFPQWQIQWQSIWNWFGERLHNPDEPHVWQSHDRGITCWHAYDPITRRSFACESETEMRQWLEERYYYRQAEFVMPDGR